MYIPIAPVIPMASIAAISTDEDAPGADPAQPADERRKREGEQHADGERQQHRPAEIERRHHDRGGHEAQISQIKIGRIAAPRSSPPIGLFCATSRCFIAGNPKGRSKKRPLSPKSSRA